MSRQKELIDIYLSGMSSFNIKKILLPLHSKIVFENYTNGELQLKVEGQKKFKKIAQRGAEMYTKRTQEILSIEHEEDKSTLLVNYSWTFKIDLGDKKAGQTVNQTGKAIYHFKDDRISKIELHG